MQKQNYTESMTYQLHVPFRKKSLYWRRSGPHGDVFNPDQHFTAFYFKTSGQPRGHWHHPSSIWFIVCASTLWALFHPSLKLHSLSLGWLRPCFYLWASRPPVPCTCIWQSFLNGRDATSELSYIFSILYEPVPIFICEKKLHSFRTNKVLLRRVSDH